MRAGTDEGVFDQSSLTVLRRLLPLVLSAVLLGGGIPGASAQGNGPAGKPRAAAAGVSKAPERSGPSVNVAPPEMATVFDPAFRPAAKDLSLGLEGDRKAQAQAHFLQGILLEDTSDPDQATAEYLKSLNLDPANTELSIKLARQYAAQGDSANAIGVLKDNIKALPKESGPYLALSYIYFKLLARNDLAQKYAIQALDVDPGNMLVYQYLKEIYGALGQEQKIGPLLDRAARVDSKESSFWLKLGELSADAERKGNAGKNPDGLKKTAAIYQKALALAPNDPETLARVADFYVAALQPAAAIPLYKKAVAAEPGLVAARENLARCYLATDQRDNAVACLEEIIKINPMQQQAYEFLGEIYEKAKDYDRAFSNYQQSVLISPNRPENYDRLAVLLLDKFKQPEKAIPLLTEARRRFPDQPWFSYLRAAALGQAKRTQEALTAFEQTALDAQNLQPKLLTSRFYFEYGTIAERAGLYEKAGLLVRKALEMEDDPPAVAQMANYLGYMYVDHHLDIEEGGNLIRRALELEPDNGAYRDSLGWYYYRTNKFDKALAELMKAAETLKPEDAVIYEHLGDTYLKLNDTANAVASWQKAMSLDPEEPGKAGLAKKLDDAKAQLTKGPAPEDPAAPPSGKR